MHGLTKRIFLASRECLRQGWYLQHAESTEPATDADKFRMAQGDLIGQQAWLLYPGGILVQERRLGDAAKRTSRLLADSEVSAIFEAAFRRNECAARADLLIRGNGGWVIKEVKSVLANGEPPDELVDDVGYTVMVARDAGLPVEQCSLLLLSRDYRLSMPPQSLFVEIDVTQKVEARLSEFAASLDQIKAALSRPAPPPARLIPACRSCGFFGTECLGHTLDHPVIEIPRLHKNRLAALADQGITEILSVPSDFPLSGTQRIAVDCIKTDREYIGPSLSVDLAKVQWPAAYLDFETVATAVPLYQLVVPYEQVTTQFSVHQCDQPGHVVTHHEFLADPTRDCRRELAESLLAFLSDQGSVIVYHAAFERGQLARLANLFPDLAVKLNAVIGRLFDLEVVIRRGYYHPALRGSYSIKRVLPVLVPNLSYEGLPIGNGDTAVTKFARMAMGQFNSGQAAEVRRDLLAYCHLDTLAMVELHRELLEIAGAQP